MKIEKTRSLYIDPKANGTPYHSPKAVLGDLFDGAESLALKRFGIGTRPGKGRTKLVVTVTVEEVAA